MKKLFLTTALLALIASPAIAASVTGELRVGSDKGKSPTEYVLDYQAPFFQIFPNLNYGVELATKQQPASGSIASKAVARVGVDLPKVLGFNVGGNVQLGRGLGRDLEIASNTVVKGRDYNLYGKPRTSFWYYWRCRLSLS